MGPAKLPCYKRVLLYPTSLWGFTLHVWINLLDSVLMIEVVSPTIIWISKSYHSLSVTSFIKLTININFAISGNYRGNIEHGTRIESVMPNFTINDKFYETGPQEKCALTVKFFQRHNTRPILNWSTITNWLQFM